MSRLNLVAETETEKYLLDYLEANASPSLVGRINAGKKTLAGCFSYLTDWARKTLKPKNGVAGAPDPVVFGQAVHYFEEDDLDFEGKPAAARVTTRPIPAADPASPAATAPVRPKRGSKAKVAAVLEAPAPASAPAPKPVDQTKVNAVVDSIIASVGLAAPKPAAAPAPSCGEALAASPSGPVQLDWLSEFGL